MASQRPRFPPPPPWHAELATVGVTGTNGKTTTTTYVARALSHLSGPVPRVTTVGFYVGDEKLDEPPGFRGFLKTLALGHQRGARHAAIELSSEALANGFIRAWPCQVGVFTNLTRDHLDRHGSPEHYLASKAQLFAHLPLAGAAVLNGCDPASTLLAEIIPEGVRVLRYGISSRGTPALPLDLGAKSVAINWEGTRLELETSDAFDALPTTLELRALGQIFAENALAALAAATALGVPARVAADLIAQTPSPPGRFEVVRTNPHVVIDYAHTPDALTRTVSTANGLKRGSLTVVFGAGGERDHDKRPMMGSAASGADRVILTSDNPRSEDPAAIANAIATGLQDHPSVTVLLDRAEAIRSAIRESRPGDVVLVAGKGHETEQHTSGGVRPFSDRDVARSA